MPQHAHGLDVKTAVSGSSAEVTSETKTSASQQHINCAHLSSSQSYALARHRINLGPFSDLSEEDSEEQLDPQDKGEPKSDDIDSDASAFKAFGPSVARQPVSEGLFLHPPKHYYIPALRFGKA